MPITQESEHTLNDITWNFPKKGLKIKKTQKANHPMPLVEMVLSSRPPDPFSTLQEVDLYGLCHPGSLDLWV